MGMWCRYPNGCSLLEAAKQNKWKEGKQFAEAVSPWVMWHAACLEGLQQKGKAMQGLLDLHAQSLANPPSRHAYAL